MAQVQMAPVSEPGQESVSVLLQVLALVLVAKVVPTDRVNLDVAPMNC